MKLEELTNRELDLCEVCIQLKGDISHKKIAKIMHLQPCTIMTHLKNIYSKLYINSKAELIYLLLTNPPHGLFTKNFEVLL